MGWIFPRICLVTAAILASAACDQLSNLGLGPHPAASAPAERVEAPAVADLRQHAGEMYPDFVAGEGARYSPPQIGLGAGDRDRLEAAMAAASAGRIEQGGGAEALVFRGCAEGGCDAGTAVVAVDTATGGVFAAVRDGHGADVFAPNDRVEALLRLNSPVRRWDTPAPTQTASAEVNTP